MKKCPFCKNNIKSDASECPHCRRILIEYTGNYSPVKDLSNKNNNDSFLKKIKDKILNFLKSQLNKISHLRFSKLSFNPNYLWIIPIIVFIIVIASGKTINPTDNSSTNTSEELLPTNYARLPNGTRITSTIDSSNGLGTLEIDNGTDDDAIAKLIDINNGLTVITVYIQAKSKFTITSISDGKYDLFFHTGKDWNEEKKKFLFNPSYSKFSDDFIYTTTETKYKVYEVTLNPVVGGTAETNTVTESEFEKH